MTIQLLFNEENVKSLLPISQNIAGEYLSSAMFEAQEIGLKNIIGSRLLRKMKELAAKKELHDQYAELRDNEMNYLIYQTIVYLINKVRVKIANAGAVQTTDTNMQHPPKVDIDALIEEYQGKADFFCYELQEWLRENRCLFPELDGCHKGGIAPNLERIDTCGGIYLDGPRGYKEA